mgnify:CR=1 FL=1
MTYATSPLFPSLPTRAHEGAAFGTGILPSQTIHALICDKEIVASVEISADQVQPASLDLRLGPVAYRVRTSSSRSRQTS